MAQDNVKKFLGQFAEGISELAGVVASNYAREYSMALVEEWAQIIIDGIMNGEFNLEALSDATKDRRAANPNALNYSTPLAETGLMLQSLVFEIHVDPMTKYHTIVVGFEDEVENRTSKSVAEIAAMHEYGIGVPARPFFYQSMTKIGYREHRIFNKTFQEAKVHLAQGFSPQGITRRENAGITPNALEQGIRRGKNNTLTENKKGKIIQNGTHFEFQWVS